MLCFHIEPFFLTLITFPFFQTAAAAAAAKKDPKDKQLSSGIQKFLASKDAKSKQKKADDNEKMQNLFALRSQDKKSTRLTNSMLKRTKSSNKSAIAEAINVRDTEATLAGRFQCDNDDYGYESKAASSIYEKLIQKYEKNPEDPMAKFARPHKPKSDVNATLTRIKSSVASGDSSFQPFRNKKSETKSDKKESTSKSLTSSSSSSPESSSSTSAKKSSSSSIVKRNTNAPPPPSFSELLKMAKDKGGQPSLSKTKKDTKEGEFQRPMTAKEKTEYIRERDSQLRKAGKLPPAAANNKTDAASKKGPEFHPGIVGNSSSKGGSALTKVAPKGPCKENNFTQPTQSKAAETRLKRDIHSVESRAFPGEVRPPPTTKRYKPGPKSAVGKQRDQVRNDQRDRSPESPVRRTTAHAGTSSKSHNNNPNRIESDDDEDDYDSEDDNFIDDTDAKVDISAEIRNIFGYDKRKFRDEPDFDDRSMENNRYADVMKEEARSARIGRMEDQEEEEKQRKEQSMKKKKSRR
jgi:protein SPT2